MSWPGIPYPTQPPICFLQSPALGSLSPASGVPLTQPLACPAVIHSASTLEFRQSLCQEAGLLSPLRPQKKPHSPHFISYLLLGGLLLLQHNWGLPHLSPLLGWVLPKGEQPVSFSLHRRGPAQVWTERRQQQLCASSSCVPAERMTENKDICFICFRTVAHPLLPKHTAASSTETSIGTQEKMAVAQGSADCGPITGSFFRAPSHCQGQDGGLLLNPAKENRSQFSHGPLFWEPRTSSEPRL